MSFFLLIVALAILATTIEAGISIPKSTKFSASIDEQQTGVDGLNFDISVPFKVNDYVIGFRSKVNDALNFPIRSLFAKKSFDVADGVLSTNFDLDMDTRNLGLSTDWTADGMTIGGDFDVANKLKKVSISKILDVLEGRKVAITGSYDLLKKKFYGSTTVDVDASKIKLAYDSAKNDPVLTIAHSINDNNEISPSVSSSGKVDFAYTRKWEGGSIKSNIDLNKNVELTWKDSGAGGSWRTVANVPLTDRQNTKISLSRDWSY